MRYLLAGSDYFGSISADPIKEAFVCLTSSLTIFSALRKCHSDQIPFPEEESAEGVGQLPSALLHEGRGGMRRDAGDLHAPGGQLHHHKHIIGHQAMPRRHLHAEEVRRGEDLPMELQKLSPAHARLATLRRRIDVVATQDIAHRQFV